MPGWAVPGRAAPGRSDLLGVTGGVHLTSTVGRALSACAATAALFAGNPVAVAAPAPAPAPPEVTGPTAPYGRLRLLADLSAQRLATADLVAAAKYGTDSPIDDPAREKQVLDAVARQARETGGDPEATVRIFRDQIDANKVVQRGLFRRWDADPSQVPKERPDLTEVREEINRINGGLVRGIARQPTRAPPRTAGES